MNHDLDVVHLGVVMMKSSWMIDGESVYEFFLTLWACVESQKYLQVSWAWMIYWSNVNNNSNSSIESYYNKLRSIMCMCLISLKNHLTIIDTHITRIPCPLETKRYLYLVMFTIFWTLQDDWIQVSCKHGICDAWRLSIIFVMSVAICRNWVQPPSLKENYATTIFKS